jgi:hypothetical protein
LNIRSPEVLGPFIGKTIVDITQHDEHDWSHNNERFVQIMFDDGSWVKFPVSQEDGFWFSLGAEEEV